MKSAILPLNRRYHELKQEEKEALHGLWEKIEEGDEPPFPTEGLLPIVDAVRKAQARRLVEGSLVLHVDVDANGDPQAVKVLVSPDREMTQFVSSVLMLTKFKPALCRGAPCRMEYPFKFDFRVR